MTEFQALISGAVMGALMKASADSNLSPEGGPLLIDVEPVVVDGNYTNEIKVRGRESGERLLIRVEVDE